MKKAECNDLKCKHIFDAPQNMIRGNRTALILCPKCGRYDSAYIVEVENIEEVNNNG